MQVWLARDVLFHDCACHGKGMGYVTYKTGTQGTMVGRDAIEDQSQRYELVKAVERMGKDGVNACVVKLGGGYRILRRADVLTEAQLIALQKGRER